LGGWGRRFSSLSPAWLHRENLSQKKKKFDHSQRPLWINCL
jgi:hypothetical protein